ncbi:MAG: DUF1501 domain-containing protein [Planctomycetaceae bacterium]|nr:DUF1501 domain-containing protein [Planctomycetaceae bacterium]
MPLSRRDVLQLAAALGLSFRLPSLDLRAAERRGGERPKSLLVMWLAGGPSQLETWDPHPGGKIGGPTKGIDTTIRGAQIAADYPKLAEQIHRLSIVRSLVSKEGDHERGAYFVKTGYRPDPTLLHPALGAIVTHEVPAPTVEIPTFVALGEDAFQSRGGYLGNRFDPYRVYEPGGNGENLQASAEPDRQQRRLQALGVVSSAFQRGRTKRVAETLHQHTIDAALKMMDSKQLEAFKLEHEPAAVRAAYGDSRFGRGCLVARRLLEQGVRAIEITQNGFDTHADNFTGHTLRAGYIDPALSSLLTDLADRDLLQSTIVLVIGEFGRSPTINAASGRDHWPTGFSCLVGGGGLVAGLVIGETDPTGEKKDPVDPIEVPDLYATILKSLGIDFARELITPIGRPMKLCQGRPIERLLAQA